VDEAVGREQRLMTRATLLQRGALGAGGAGAVTLVVLGLAPRTAISTPSPQTDRSILNFLLLLERTQEAFYTRARRDLALRGELRQFVDIVGAQERTHVEQLAAALGPAADPPPLLELDAVTADAEQVRATAVALEDLALAGYNGQLPRLTADGLRPVLRIASVEARHAAWVRDLAGAVPAPVAADELASEHQTRATLRQAGIVVKERP
jgi:hypothetical protein